MAEFCLDCWNRLNETNLTEKDVVLSSRDDMDLCEGCGQWKQVVVCMRRRSFSQRLESLLHRLAGR